MERLREMGPNMWQREEGDDEKSSPETTSADKSPNEVADSGIKFGSEIIKPVSEKSEDKGKPKAKIMSYESIREDLFGDDLDEAENK